MQTANRPSQIARTAAGLAAGCLLAALAGCSSKGDSFNDIIPKLLGPQQTPVSAAGDAFDPTSADRRRAAIAYLSSKKWGHEEAYMKAYNLLATDPDPLVKGQAMRALGESGNQEVAAVLIKGLEDPNELVRQDASAACQKITNAKLIDPLIAHMKKDADLQTRINATQALARYHTPKVYMYLAAMLDDKDPAITYWAMDNLTKGTGQRNLPGESKSCQAWVVQHYPEAAKINTREES